MLHVHNKNCGCNVKRLSFEANARVDPTKTTVVRARYERDLVRRFKKVKKAIGEYLDMAGSQLVTNAPSDKHKQFMRWLKDQMDRNILEVTQGPAQRSSPSHWQNLYIKSAYRRGMDGAAKSIKKAGGKVADSWIDSGFNRSFHADRVGLIYTKAYSELEGITAAMDKRISSTLATGMAQGKGIREIGKMLDEAVDKIGINRARLLARTEVISAHAEATLNTYEEARIEGVEVLSEFTTSQDNKVCQKCEALEGRTYTPSEARGVIPVHPNCRCAWVPVIPDATGVELY